MGNMLQGKYLEGIGEGIKIECNIKDFVKEGDGNTRKRKNQLQGKQTPEKKYSRKTRKEEESQKEESGRGSEGIGKGKDA